MRRVVSGLLALVVLIVAGCGEATAPDGAAAGKGLLQGQIVAPVEGIYLYVYKPGMDLYGPAFAVSQATGADGRYQLELPDGDYVAVARKRHSGDANGPVMAGDQRSEFVQVTVRGGVVTLDLSAPVKVGDQRNFTGDPGEASTGIAGRVLDSDGQPVADARVHVYDHVQMSERPKFVSEKTGPDGRYHVPLPAGGTYYLAARDKFGGPPKLGDLYGRYDKGTIEPSAVVVREGELLKAVDITVTKVW
ncbi:MAG: carboxypeptidase-like regulatory domain-containing protein [Desulfuromonadales bacterium]|nr:carboxypeptidase-like regulatory domain-containing protein [Desulfuromonadales bacterium]